MKEKFKFSRFTIFCLIMYIMTFVLIFPNAISAKYVRQDDTTSTSKVADFIFMVEDESGSFAVNLLDKVTKPADKASYTFTIKNFANGNLSELPIVYEITLQVVGNIPLKCSLLREGENQFTISADGESKRSMQGVMNIEENEISFKIEVEWPADKNESSYFMQDAIGVLLLTIQANQID